MADEQAEADERSARRARRGLLALFAALVLSALVFMLTVDRPVFDDTANLRDIERYATLGVDAATLGAHVNPAGPLSYVWIAALGEALGGGLLGFRLAVLASWLLLGLLAWRWSVRTTVRAPLWVPALALLTFAHVPTAMATLLTEGPALLFALGGTLVLLTTLRRAADGRHAGLGFATSGLLLGLAVVARQYYLCLLPAAALSTVWTLRRAGRAWRGALSPLLGLALALLPIALLYALWGSLTSPGMQQLGSAYTNFDAYVGVNPARVLTAALYLGVYALPLALPALLARRRRLLWTCLFGALVVAGVLRVAGLEVWGGAGTGPLQSLVSSATRLAGPLGELTFLATVAAGALGVASLTLTVTSHGDAVAREPLALLSALALAFFVLQQIGIGGNIPFYDRYVLQVIAFAGALAAVTLGAPRRWQLALLGASAALGQIMLWRHVL